MQPKYNQNDIIKQDNVKSALTSIYPVKYYKTTNTANNNTNNNNNNKGLSRSVSTGILTYIK